MKNDQERGDREYLLDLLERIQRVETFTQGGREEFFQSILIQDGVIRNFEVMGEIVKRLSSELRQKHPTVPWRQIAGFRDILIHEYLGIDLQRVWNVVEQNLLDLKAEIQLIVQELERET
jgi:uncharacterized protein with HEPN domain